MKKTVRMVSVICILAIFAASVVLLSASTFTYETPLEQDMWGEPTYSKDYAYSIAFVGDTQYITNGDAYRRYVSGNKNDPNAQQLNQIYQYIADTAEERKLKHVFILGDITDGGYWNDGNLGSGHLNPPSFDEWEVAKEAILKLSDANVSYSLCRGNHDDYSMDTYFNIPAYTDQFKGVGGFFSDVNGVHPGQRTNGSADMRTRNPNNKILWSAQKYAKTGDGTYSESIVNSYKSMEICGTKYLFVTVDFNPTGNVISWLNNLLADPQYADHRAIITTHGYLTGNGSIITSNSNDTMFPTSYTPDKLWKYCLSRHKNVFMIVSGHVGVNDIVYNYNTGELGNKVLQVLVDPQNYDLKEVSYHTSVDQGTQDTGLVLYMNFSADGNTITFNYYSTLLDKNLVAEKDSNGVFQRTVQCDDTITIPAKAPRPDVDETVVIDMAGQEFGQTSLLVTGKKSPNVNGTISSGEYSHMRTVDPDAIGNGRINSSLTEYFAYDDNYLYYAFTGDFYGIPELGLRAGDTSYTVGNLLNNDYAKRFFTLLEGTDSVTISTSATIDAPQTGKDIFFGMSQNSSTGYKTYEIKISRSYLSSKGLSDNLLPYTVTFDTGKRCYALEGDSEKYLRAFGVENLVWTYNYVYFGEKPTADENPEMPTVTPSATTPNNKSSASFDYAINSSNSNVKIMQVPTTSKTPVINGVISDGEYSYSYKEETTPIYLNSGHTTIYSNVMDTVGAQALKNSVNAGYFNYQNLVNSVKAEYSFAQDEENIYIATKNDTGVEYFANSTVTSNGVTFNKVKAIISRDCFTFRIGFDMNNPSNCIYLQNNSDIFDITHKGTKTLNIDGESFDISGNGIITQMYRCMVAKQTGFKSHEQTSGEAVVLAGQMIDHTNPGTDHYVVTEIVINKAALLEALRANGLQYNELPNAFFFSMIQNGQVIGQKDSSGSVGWLSDGNGGFWALNGSRYTGSANYGSQLFPDLVVFSDSTSAISRETINVLHTTHDWGTYLKNGEKHWKKCSCGEISELEVHSAATDWKTDGVDHWKECVCGEKVNITTEHTPSIAWQTEENAETHWKLCVCGEKVDEAAHAAQGEWQKTDTDHWKDCVCGKDMNVTAHTAATDWQTEENAETHWKLCECGEKVDEATHEYSEDWKIGEDDHYKECICGDKSEITEHEYSEDWKTDGEKHWKECVCKDKSEEATHDGGEATCVVKAKCETCGAEYGDLEEHEQVEGWKNDATNHWKECALGDKSELGAHDDEDNNGKCDICEYVVRRPSSGGGGAPSGGGAVAPPPADTTESTDTTAPTDTAEPESTDTDTVDSETVTTDTDTEDIGAVGSDTQTTEVSESNNVSDVVIESESESSVGSDTESEEDEKGCASTVSFVWVALASFVACGAAIGVKHKERDE